MKEKFRITRISIKGKGSQIVDERTDSLSAIRQQIAQERNVPLSTITFTYQERREYETI